MRNSCFALVGLVLASVCLAGCGHAPCRRSGAAQVNSPAELPSIARGNVEANIGTLPKADTHAATETTPTPPYRALTAQQTLCLAVGASPVARLQQEEIRRVAFHADGAGTDRLTSLRRAVLFYSSQEIQNQTAGSALEAYYHLAEAEGKADLLNQGVAQLSQAQRETESMTKRGLKPAIALDVWSRQLLTAQSDSIQAQMTIDKLNSEIRTLTGLRQEGENWRIWNPEKYEVSEAPIDVDAAVATGVASRPELQLLRLLVAEAGAGSTSVIDDLLRSINPLLGMNLHPCLAKLLKPIALLAINCPGSKAETRRAQLNQYLSDREAAVAEEIRRAASDLQNRTKLVALASAREHSWADKVAEVRSRQEQGLASFAEVTSTNIDWFKARADRIQEVMAWYIAWVKLRQAQGLLPADCQAAGYCR